MNIDQALDALRELGTEQNRKVYARHGVTGSLLGVSYADLGVLKKRIKQDHDLAIALWDSGIHDARVLATMIADPAKSPPALLNAWSRVLDNYVLTDALSKLAARTPAAREVAAKWVENKSEWTSACGWNIYCMLAMEDVSLQESDLTPLLARIEREIKTSKNRVRYSMNNALIAIGMRTANLAKLATSAAQRIGKVEVDHGQTGCKTPDAGTYIKKARERAEAKVKKNQKAAASPKSASASKKTRE